MTSIQIINEIANQCILNNKIDCIIISGLDDKTPLQAINYLSSQDYFSAMNWAWTFQDEKKTTLCVYQIKSK